MLSKHQQVQMLEVCRLIIFFPFQILTLRCRFQAAAILVNPGSLPEEKSLWPAAVSPPSSGLLGSDQLNLETLRQYRETRSPGQVDEEDYAESESGDEMDVDSHAGVNETGADGDGEEMFALDFGPNGSSGEERDSGYASGSVRGDSAAGYRQDGEDVKAKATIIDYRQQFEPPAGQGQQGIAMAVSAPIMGFFDQRPQPVPQSAVIQREKRDVSVDAMEE
jgi:hypothetical protein